MIEEKDRNDDGDIEKNWSNSRGEKMSVGVQDPMQRAKSP
jgi:hypothetical protein